MIGILKYRAGNTASVSHALDRLGADHVITDDPGVLETAEAVIFPGVGHAVAAMADLRSRGLDSWLRETTRPVLGICLGMQLLYEATEEGDCQTLGILPGRLRKFSSGQAKVPHMGWNRFVSMRAHPLLDQLDSESWFYYVHSYYAPVDDDTLAACHHTLDFTAVVAQDNYMGVQFHPEKSGSAGERLLRNFLDIVRPGSSRILDRTGAR